jgi:hypothetical protein
MTIKGAAGLTTKVKDFCSAWLTYTGTMSVYQAEVSDVTIDGVVADANADNHYETDGAGAKWWEAGPNLKRPPNGIQVYCPQDNPEILNAIVENCIIYRPLAGVQANGGLANLEDLDFIDGSINHSIVRGAIIRNNKVYRSRGNSYIFSSGVLSSSILDNTSIDSYYHITRFYVSVINCSVKRNKAYIDHDRMIDLYNATDNGYYRTDDSAEAGYKMTRSGYCIGSTYSVSENLAFNEVSDNEISYKRTNNSYVICDETGNSYSGLVIRDVQSFTTMSNNTINRAPFLAISLSLSPPDSTLEGIVVKDNTVNRSWRTAIASRGYDCLILRNTFNNCSQASGYPVAVISQGRAFYNVVKSEVPLANYGFSTGDAPTGTIWISDNTIINYNNTALLNPTDYDVHGTEGGGIRLALLNGWEIEVNNPASSNIAKVVKSANGHVSIFGFITGDDSTNDKIADLPSGYSPSENTYSLAFQAVTLGEAEGTIFVQRTARDGQLFISRAGRTARRCFINASWYAEKYVLPNS